MADEAILRVEALSDAFAEAKGIAGQAEVVKDSAKLVELASQAPVVRLVDQMLLEAVNRRASDVHVEAFEDTVKVRFRIDGRCYEVAETPKRLALALSSRIKVLANLDVAEARLPQDGRILLNIAKRQIDLRVSTLPTVFGESIVLRVLDRSTVNQTLGDLGIEQSMQEDLERLIEKPNGLLLVTGPTGAGKTTTLYGCLAKLNRPEVKVITTEDPVEYDIEGFVQVGINSKIQLTFAACLRAILRHDPDIVMVGEIRDAETAQVAFQAALTGHLVFSTLHTNDAPGAVTRLLDMGVEPYLITSTVSGVLAQRLVRKLCSECKTAYDPGPGELADLGIKPDALRGPLMKAAGCDACQGIGFRGRMGLFELLEMTEPLHPFVLERASVSDIRAKAREFGMHSLRADGICKVLEGITTIEEVLRETQDHG